MLSRTYTTAVILLLFIVMAVQAQAQSPFGVGSAEQAFSTSGALGGFFGWINQHQQGFYRALTASLRAMREDRSAILGLVGLSFAYGVFHAAGPGHGKAVISSYVIASNVQLRRGIAISFLSALLQGLVAMLVVGLAWFILRGWGIGMTSATRAMEIASFALVAAFGAWLLVKKTLSLLRMKEPSALPCTLGPAGIKPTSLKFEAAETTGKTRAESDRLCKDCGSMHIPQPQMLNSGKFNAGEAWSVILAVGLRPCSGAILVLSFSLLNGLYLGGTASVFAMAIGTAITVSLLAILAVTAKGAAERWSGKGRGFARWFTHAIEFGAALFVLLLGLSMLGASLQSSSYLG